jgi:hypothetical protein
MHRGLRAEGRRPRTLALGISLAARGGIARAAIALALIVAAASAGAAWAQSARIACRLPTIASIAVAWSAGVMLAFGGALRAIPRDSDEGIIALLRARGVPVGAYVRGRTAGLVLVLALTVAGATLASGLAATAVARPAGPAARAAVAALAYALAFSATLGPLALAALGARTRRGGYLSLIAVLVVPELATPWTRGLVPEGWQELTSIPAALEAVRAGVLSPRTEGAHMARAFAGLLAVIVGSLFVVRARVEMEARA